MTPLALAKAECANFKPEGCLGMEIKPDGSQVMGTFGDKHCLLAAGSRCSYFETAVAPLADYVREPHKAESYKNAVLRYRGTHPDADLADTRKCECGVSLGPRERLCSTCRKDARKESNRKAQKRRRLPNAVRLSAVNPRNTSTSLEKSHGFSAISRNPYQDSPHPKNEALTVGRNLPDRKAVGQ